MSLPKRETTDAEWPVLATDVATELRRQLDASFEVRAELDRQISIRDWHIVALQQQIAESEVERQILRGTLVGEAELADAFGDPYQRGTEYWHTAWKEVSRHRSELLVRVQQLERWLLDAGAESNQLQRELDRSREQNAGLARQLAETERDYTEMYADREELISQLARCEAEFEELRCQLAFGHAVREQIVGEPAQSDGEH